MDNLQNLLQRGRNGNALLFCGAGLTADCLNFDQDSRLGVTFHLLTLLNDELKANGKQSGFKDIRNASKRFRTDLGNYRLLLLLKERFLLNKVSATIVDIVGYPWSSIYTTNYDNGLELALHKAGKRFVPLNNLDDPNATTNGTPVIHLHGAAEAWSHSTFEQSCVLDADSYHNLSGVRDWLHRLRFDIERAEIVVFVGFSAADFHLTQVFFDTSGLKEKAFFINRPSSELDPDERATQEDFGEPLYIGREGIAQLIIEAQKQQIPVEPQLASFVRYQPPRPSASVPPVQDIEDLLIWGKVDLQHLKRDHDSEKSDYHVLRDEIKEIQNQLHSEGRIILLSGDICDGKSLVVFGVMNGISNTRAIFELTHTYADLLDETSSILVAYPNSILVVENCFSLREERLLGLARQISASKASLILTARSVSTEAELGKLKGLRAIPSLLEIGIGPLRGNKINALIALIDQIAGWRDFKALSLPERRRFVEKDCQGVIPNVLLRLLNSDYVRGKYREEYNKTSYLDIRDRQMIVAALLIANIGFDAPTSFLSDIFEQDFASVLKRISPQGGLKLVRAERGVVRTIPSIGARNLLGSVVDARDIVNTTIYILEKMAGEIRRSDFEQHVFSQLMRYSILNSTVSDVDEINRFFDHTSKIAYFRDMPLFWLQWHMAMGAQNRWVKAEEYLSMGYTAAAALEKKRGEKYNRKQLDDRKAKFLIARANSVMRSGSELFRDAKEALDIAGRLLHDSELTHHAYETLLDIAKLLRSRQGTLLEDQNAVLVGQLKMLVDLGKKKLGTVFEGYHRSRAVEWINQIEANTLG